jgi:hypothetical protein
MLVAFSSTIFFLITYVYIGVLAGQTLKDLKYPKYVRITAMFCWPMYIIGWTIKSLLKTVKFIVKD